MFKRWFMAAVLVFLVLSINGCGPQNRLVGKWERRIEGTGLAEWLTFTRDGTFIFEGGDARTKVVDPVSVGEPGNYLVKDNSKVFIRWYGNTMWVTYTYSINGNRLILDSEKYHGDFLRVEK